MTKTVIIASELSGSPQNFAIRNNFITIVILPFVGNLFIKLRLQMHWLYAMMLYICLSVCLSPETLTQNMVFSKIEQFRAMVSVDDQMKSYVSFSKNQFL